MVSLGRCCLAFVLPARSAAPASFSFAADGSSPPSPPPTALQLRVDRATARDIMPPEANGDPTLRRMGTALAPSPRSSETDVAPPTRGEGAEGRRDVPPTTIHFCFIVHGHQGRPGDLSFLHHAVKSTAGEWGRFDVKSSETCAVGRMSGVVAGNAAEGNAQDGRRARRRGKRDRMPLPSSPEKGDRDERTKDTLVVHNAACNEGRTGDGIARGGMRLADEMLDVIRCEVRRKLDRDGGAGTGGGTPVVASVSLVGNSLGGLYGRYAVAHLAEVLDNPDEKEGAMAGDSEPTTPHYLLDGRIRVHFNVFCSTASPHLGCASHTYLPLPRAAEVGVAKAMGETGADLFRLNDLVEKMATSPRFLAPLASFRRRVAYANAYKTDFPVPGATAAFLDRDNEYPHYFDEQLAEGAKVEMRRGGVVATESRNERTLGSRGKARDCPASERGLIVATLYTPQSSLEESEWTRGSSSDLAYMSASLDSLGWKKVMVDIRSEIPRVSLPSPSGPDCPLRQLQSSNRTSVSSRDLERAVSTTSARRLGLPLGHNAICAFSRSSVSTALNKGGRPVMESLAIELIGEISSFAGPN